MCGCGGFYPQQVGIPIPDEVHEQYSDDLKSVWIKFDTWWKKAQESTLEGELVDRKTMPNDVKGAMNLILETPIPGFEGATGADSCYMIGVQNQMTDPE